MDRKGCSLSDGAVEIDHAAVGLDDPLRDGQADAAPRRFGCEEGRKGRGCHVVRHSRACVREQDDDVVFGFGDVDLWGKYQIIDDPILLAAGILFTLPTGGEKIVHPWATGEFNFEGFGAMRYYLNDTVALIGHLFLRFNSDMDVKVGSAKAELDGEVSFGIGGGAVVEVTPGLNVMGQLGIETERYKDADNNIEITGEAEYFVSENISINGGIGVGLDDMAPEFEIILGAGMVL